MDEYGGVGAWILLYIFNLIIKKIFIYHLEFLYGGHTPLPTKRNDDITYRHFGLQLQGRKRKKVYMYIFYDILGQSKS
jgi:hypothetical protein